MKNWTREEMQDIIIGIYGLEHPMTVAFFKKCEELPETDLNNATLEFIVELHQASPVGMNS